MQWRRRLLGPQGLRSKIKALILLVTLVIAFSLVAPFARAETVVATVNVGSNPFGVAYDSLKGEVFVANFGSNTVSVIEDSTNTVVATVSVGGGAAGVADYVGSEVVVVMISGSNTDAVVAVDT